MALKEHLEKIRQLSGTILLFKEKSLIRRPEWGAIHFEKAEQDIEEAFSLAENLNTLPIEHLTDSVAAQIANCILPVESTLKEISNFSIDKGGDPNQRRDALSQQLHNQLQELANPSLQQIPYLLMKRGDIDSNISKLQGAITQAEQMVGGAEKWVTDKKAEIQKISDEVRNAAAEAGAAVFSTVFLDTADKQEEAAGSWLLATGLAAVSTIIVAALFLAFMEPVTDAVVAVQKLTPKLVILGILGGVAVWCSHIYRALKHQAAVNRHRGVSIQTLRAFRAAAVEQSVQDAVVLEATRAVFGASATGYVEGKDPDPRTSVMELTRMIGKG